MLALLALFACTAEDVDLPEAKYSSDSTWIWSRPWPSDDFLTESGTPDLSNFPNPYGIQLMDTYIALGEQQSGWGNNSGITFPIDGDVDFAMLPSPSESLELGSTILLVDVDPDSPYRGERFPVQWHWEDVGSRYIDPDVLTVAPVYGFPLRPSTTYAVVLTNDMVRRPAAFDEALDESLYAPLLDDLIGHGLTRDDIGMATVLTTNDPVSEMAIMARYVKENVELPDMNLDLELKSRRTPYFDAWRTHYPSPVFTHGERPFTTVGGAFQFDETGTPIIARWDDMRLSVCTPQDLSNPPEGGWPVVIYQHGTGGDYDGYCNSARWLEPGSRIIDSGAIGIGIDQPLHGTRSGDYDLTRWPENPGSASDLAHFNIINPEGARANFRQGGLDAIYLAHAVASQPWAFTTEDGDEVPLNPDKVLFLGHSQGGLTGALAVPWFGSDVKGSVLSGAGGILAVTIVKRKDPLDFAALVQGILQFDEGEQIHTLHPVTSLVQWLVDPTDPVNYGPYWFSEPGWWGEAPANVLLTSGTLDHATDYETAVALAASARMPVVHPRASTTDALDLRGLALEQGPVSMNVEGWDGKAHTAALSQWVDGSHWVIFEEHPAAQMYEDFLHTAAEGDPVIYRELP